MENLRDIYYLIQLIVKQILIFLRDYIFREFTWFTSMEEDFDDTSSKIRTVAPHYAIADVFVFLTVCGLLFAFMNLSSNSPKTEAMSGYGTNNAETIKNLKL